MPELRRSHRRLARQSPARRFRGFPRAEGDSACPSCGGVTAGSRDSLRLVVSAGFRVPRVVPRARVAAESPSARAIVSGSSFWQVSTCRGWFRVPELRRSHRRLARSSPARRFGRFPRAEGGSACPSCGGVTAGSRDSLRLVVSAGFRVPRVIPRARVVRGYLRLARSRPARGSAGSPRAEGRSACRIRAESPEVPADLELARLRLAESAPARRFVRFPRARGRSACRASPGVMSGSREQLRLAIPPRFHEPRVVPRAGVRLVRPPARGSTSGSRARPDSACRGRFREPNLLQDTPRPQKRALSQKS
ncbi:hypothetical protein EDF36_0306 [Rathayibacter sp. PhB152]|nr:hypothetical protein EDF36_0306 [Rathayibacter sp. PhB152]